jgi:hypothetical protein
MAYTASIYFLGQYRPAYFEAETATRAFQAAAYAVAGCEDQKWLIERLDEALARVTKPNCAAASIEHGARGVSIANRPHDPFLDRVTRSMPAYPGLDYSNAVNQ